MRRNVYTAPLGRLGLALSLSLSLMAVGCSGSQDAEEPVVAEDESSDDEAAKDEAAETVTSETAVAAPAEVEKSVPTPIEQVPEAPAATAAAPATAAPAMPAGGPNRVVRYLKGETQIFAEPRDGATSVAVMKKGDRVLVTEEGPWARIADGMFVKSSSLSRKAVAPTRQKAVWKAPTH